MGVRSLFQPKVAGDHLAHRVVTAGRDVRVADALRNMRGHQYDCLENLHVLDELGRLVGLVPLARLISADDNARLATLMVTELPTVCPNFDQEQLFPLARIHRIATLPVVGRKGRLLVCVPPQALVEIGYREHAEDVSRMAGILHQENHGRQGLEAPPWRRAFNRLPWLLVGLVGSAVATMIVARFEERLSIHIAVAFFIPAIVYLADAVGTQTEAVVVRGLSLPTALRLPHLLIGEFSAGIIIGAHLAQSRCRLSILRSAIVCLLLQCR